MRDWERAWHRALYGRSGVFRGPRRAPGHFRTAPQVGDEFALAVLTLAERVDRRLGRPDRFDLVDLGSGGGELAAALHRLRPDDRYRVIAVDLADRPADLDPAVPWRRALPAGRAGLVIANEWLDSVPCPVVTRHDGTVHRLLVDTGGRERLGPPAGAAEQAWLRRWWPLECDGDRAEVGIPRDRAWQRARSTLCRGLLVAVDYAHDRSGRPPAGTLTGYRDGRQVPPRPDGSCDLTAHVALDACAPGALRSTQARVLDALGVRAPVSVGTVDALAARGRVHELTDPSGMGRFDWAVTGFGAVSPADILPELSCAS